MFPSVHIPLIVTICIIIAVITIVTVTSDIILENKYFYRDYLSHRGLFHRASNLDVQFMTRTKGLHPTTRAKG